MIGFLDGQLISVEECASRLSEGCSCCGSPLEPQDYEDGVFIWDTSGAPVCFNCIEFS